MAEEARALAPDERCPKCSHRKASASQEACARCGLAFALWDPASTPRLVPLDDRAEALWKDAVSAWDNPTAHDAFLKHCSMAGLLPAAGRRYREKLDAHPHDLVAAQMQKRVLAMATALLGAPTQKPSAPFTRSAGFWLILLSALFLGIIGALMFKR